MCHQTKAKETRMTCLYEVFVILVRTGLRSGELCQLQLDNIDLEKNQITLKSSQTKAHRSRTVFISPKVKEALEGLSEKAKAEKRAHLIYTRSGKTQTPEHINRRLRNLLNKLEKEGKIENSREIHVHTLRRTFISHMIMQGIPPIKVMSWVGHQQWNTIKRYLVLSPDYVSQGWDVLPY